MFTIENLDVIMFTWM